MVMRFLRRLSPLAPWRLLRTLDAVRELPALRTKVQRGLKETKRLQKQILNERRETQRGLDALTKQMRDERKEVQQGLKALKKQMLHDRNEARQGLDALTKQIRDERNELAVLSTRVQQFEAVYESDTRAARSPDRALKRIGDARVPVHVREVVAAAPLESDPFPHIVLNDLLPDDAYDALVAAIPPPLFFEHLPVNRQDLKVPFEFAPRHHREVWQAFHAHIVMNALVPALCEKFRNGLDLPVRTDGSGIVDSMADTTITQHPVKARVLRRRPGYGIKPHRDPRWAFLTCILYLTKRDDPQLYGTQLCRLRRERETTSHTPLYFEEHEVETVREVPGRPNSAVVFLNSTGAHRASIPSDAPPETDRYIYQLLLEPEPAVRAALNARLPAEHARQLDQSDREFKY